MIIFVPLPPNNLSQFVLRDAATAATAVVLFLIIRTKTALFISRLGPTEHSTALIKHQNALSRVCFKDSSTLSHTPPLNPEDATRCHNTLRRPQSCHAPIHHPCGTTPATPRVKCIHFSCRTITFSSRFTGNDA